MFLPNFFKDYEYLSIISDEFYDDSLFPNIIWFDEKDDCYKFNFEDKDVDIMMEYLILSSIYTHHDLISIFCNFIAAGTKNASFIEMFAQKVYLIRQEFLANPKFFYQKYLVKIKKDINNILPQLDHFMENNKLGFGLINFILPISAHICIREYLGGTRPYEYTDKLYKLSQKLCSQVPLK